MWVPRTSLAVPRSCSRGQFTPLGVVAAAAHDLGLGLGLQRREGSDLETQFGNAARSGGLIEHLLFNRLDFRVRRFVQIVGIEVFLAEADGLSSSLQELHLPQTAIQAFASAPQRLVTCLTDPAIDQRRGRRKIRGGTQERENLLEHLVEQWESAECLPQLEHDEKRQPLRIAGALPKHQRCFLDRRAEASAELLIAELLGEARIGGTLDRGHRCCALQSGVRKTSVKSTDLRLGISGTYGKSRRGYQNQPFLVYLWRHEQAGCHLRQGLDGRTDSAEFWRIGSFSISRGTHENKDLKVRKIAP